MIGQKSGIQQVGHMDTRYAGIARDSQGQQDRMGKHQDASNNGKCNEDSTGATKANEISSRQNKKSQRRRR